MTAGAHTELATPPYQPHLHQAAQAAAARQGHYLPHLHQPRSGLPGEGGRAALPGWPDSHRPPFGPQTHPSHLVHWTQHAARLLLPHSMRDVADLLMGDGWRPGLAEALPTYQHSGAGPAGAPPPPQSLAEPSVQPIWPPMAMQQRMADSAGGSGAASGPRGPGRPLVPVPPSGPPGGPPSRLVSKRSCKGSRHPHAPGAALAPPGAPPGAKDLPAAELLAGRHPPSHVRLLMASDPAAVSQLLASLPGVDAKAACVRATVAALGGHTVPAALVASAEPPSW